MRENKCLIGLYFFREVIGAQYQTILLTLVCNRSAWKYFYCSSHFDIAC